MKIDVFMVVILSTVFQIKILFFYCKCDKNQQKRGHYKTTCYNYQKENQIPHVDAMSIFKLICSYNVYFQNCTYKCLTIRYKLVLQGEKENLKSMFVYYEWRKL